MDGDLTISNSVTVPANELVWRTTASGGPGGQHANRANTRVELVFEIETSPSLSDGVRRRLADRFGPRLRVVVDETRSQHRNRELAAERMREQLAEALRPVRKRRPTKPTRGSKERRITAKKQRSQTKQGRGRYRGDG